MRCLAISACGWVFAIRGIRIRNYHWGAGNQEAEQLMRQEGTGRSVIVHFFDVLNCCNEEQCQIIIYIYTQSCPKLQGTKSNMTRIYYYWVIYLCCNGGQSAWQGSWHTWHVTPWSWLMSQSISGHGPWSGTEGPRVRADNWGRVIITTLCRIKSWRGRHSGHSFVVLGDWNIKTRLNSSI